MRTAPLSLPPQGKDAEHTLPKRQSMNLHSLIVRGHCALSPGKGSSSFICNRPSSTFLAVRTRVGGGGGAYGPPGPTVFMRRRPRRVAVSIQSCPEEERLGYPAPRHNAAIEAREKSLRKAGPAPPAGSQTLEVTFACTVQGLGASRLSA